VKLGKFILLYSCSCSAHADKNEGMLSSAETIDIIAETLVAHQVPSVVLDPVALPYLIFFTCIQASNLCHRLWFLRVALNYCLKLP
jgi:hypothetical protein